MKQSTFTIIDICIILLAIVGVLWLVDRIARSSFTPQPAPVVSVTVNLPETKSKELTAGDYAKGLLKIGLNKTCETLISPIRWVSGFFR